MKYTGTTIVTVPFKDGTENHCQVLKFEGECDSRWLLRQVIKYIKKAFGTTVDKAWVKDVCSINNYPQVSRQVTDEDIERFIAFMEEGADDEDQDITDTASESQTVKDSG